MNRGTRYAAALLVAALSGSGALTPAGNSQVPDPSISVDATHSLGPVNRNLFGINVPVHTLLTTLQSLLVLQRMKALGPSSVRWPGGNEACTYNWKIHGFYRDTMSASWGPNIDDIAAWCDSIGAELQITVNFGTMRAQDAADLVEYCNSPDTLSGWGALRRARGHPQPFGVRYWEIGNELYSPNMWSYSWSATNPEKYYFGGSEERRGVVHTSQATRFRGDFHVSNGQANQEYDILFPDVVPGSDTVRIGADTSSFSVWTRAEDLDTKGPCQCYELDYGTGVLRFGDGLHGCIPPAGEMILCEYTTTNHDGFLAFHDAMVMRDPDIKIGSCLSPGPWSRDTLDLIFSRIDFDIQHYYQWEDSTDTPSYYERMVYASRIVDYLTSRREQIDAVAGPFGDSVGIGLTEWNFLLTPAGAPLLDATLASGLFAADLLGSLLYHQDLLDMGIANQYDAVQDYLDYFALLQTGPNYVPRPAWFSLDFFTRSFGQVLVPNEVCSSFFEVDGYYYPYLACFSSTNAGGDSVYLIVVNKDSLRAQQTTIDIAGTDSLGPNLYFQILAGDSVYSTNEGDSLAVAPVTGFQAASTHFSFSFPAHSVSTLQLGAPHTDVGLLAIPGFPDTLDQGTSVIPRVEVRNFGNSTVSADIGIMIGSNAYAESQTVELPPFATDTLDFRPWLASGSGYVEISARCSVAGDQNPANNRLLDSTFVAIRDVACVGLLAPGDTLLWRDRVEPEVVISNEGNCEQTFAITVTILADTAILYTDTLRWTLSPLATETVVFQQYTAADAGTVLVRAQTDLPGDMNRDNDVLIDSSFVILHDVGVTEIIAPPDTILPGSVIPMVMVRNFGNVAEDFPVEMRISNTYVDTEQVILGGGSSSVVTFAPWLAVHGGSQPIRVRTLLATDMHTADDNIESSVFVSELEDFETEE